jgi:glutathione peroxidase
MVLPALLASSPAPKASDKDARPSSFYALRATSIDGVTTPLSNWRGKVVLVVNTASQCGNTPQYAGLQQLWERYRARGFAVLGFPSDDFAHQEPGTEAEIKKFCSLNYRVTFPMFAKVVTHGPGQSPVYRFLTAKHGVPDWNFHKYLVGKDGQVVRAFGPGLQPDDAGLRAAIDAALAR